MDGCCQCAMRTSQQVRTRKLSCHRIIRSQLSNLSSLGVVCFDMLAVIVLTYCCLLLCLRGVAALRIALSLSWCARLR